MLIVTLQESAVPCSAALNRTPPPWLPAAAAESVCIPTAIAHGKMVIDKALRCGGCATLPQPYCKALLDQSSNAIVQCCAHPRTSFSMLL